MTTASPAVPRGSGAWQRADDLAQHVYRVTWKFMQHDGALVQRMRGAAISVAAHIAEAKRAPGAARARRSLQAASMALGELGYYAHFARRAGLLGELDLRRFAALEGEVTDHLDALLSGRANGTTEPEG